MSTTRVEHAPRPAAWDEPPTLRSALLARLLLGTCLIWSCVAISTGALAGAVHWPASLLWIWVAVCGLSPFMQSMRTGDSRSQTVSPSALLLMAFFVGAGLSSAGVALSMRLLRHERLSYIW